MNKLPSIFNDVIGPVMRGPSSSHTAASWRIAKTCLDILNEPLKEALIDFDKNSIWSTNYRDQGTVMGINGGLLGLEITDDRMKNSEQLAVEFGISIEYQINSFPTKHVNTVRLRLKGINGKSVKVVAASLGGGSFEIQQIDDFDVSIYGDYHELIIYCDEDDVEKLKQLLAEDLIISYSSLDRKSLINIKSPTKFNKEVINIINDQKNYSDYKIIKPVLPIISGNSTALPFTSIKSLLHYAEEHDLDLAGAGILYESCISGLNNETLNNKMDELISIIERSIQMGLNGTDFKDRILPQQSHLINKAEKENRIPNNLLMNKTISYVSAIMESKSAMEVIVANPTAGSCGTVGGVLKAVADDIGATKEDLIKAYFAAGLVGAYFAKGPGFSAEEHGCQVECGAAAGMAAAGIVQLYGGSCKQAISAASMAIQNMIGSICDPIADRVEAPCLGKNISAAFNALSSATMACAGFNQVIPFDEVLETVSQVSSQMPTCVKCTGKGGLAVTPTAISIKEKLNSD
jgi:L-serine dehydratase